MSQQGSNCGFGLAAAVPEHTVLADINLFGCCVDTGHHFPASVVQEHPTFPLPSLQPYVLEAPTCSHSREASVHSQRALRVGGGGSLLTWPLSESPADGLHLL